MPAIDNILENDFFFLFCLEIKNLNILFFISHIC